MFVAGGMAASVDGGGYGAGFCGYLLDVRLEFCGCEEEGV